MPVPVPVGKESRSHRSHILSITTSQLSHLLESILSLIALSTPRTGVQRALVADDAHRAPVTVQGQVQYSASLLQRPQQSERTRDQGGMGERERRFHFIAHADDLIFGAQQRWPQPSSCGSNLTAPR